MDYDYKKKLIWSVAEDSTELYRGSISLIVNDNAGNSEIYESTIEEELPSVKITKSTKNRKYSKSKKISKKPIKGKNTNKKKRKK